jgi:hypothetical protein
LVRQYEASVKLDQAQIDTASLQLAYAHITAPIAGRVGLRLVDLGNMIHASDANGIAVITQLRPITVVFAIPQDALPAVLKRFKSGEPMVVEAFDRDGRTLLATGRLVTIDNQIDPTTGTVKLRAEFPNTDEMLFPNQFVNVQLIAAQIQGRHRRAHRRRAARHRGHLRLPGDRQGRPKDGLGPRGRNRAFGTRHDRHHQGSGPGRCRRGGRGRQVAGRLRGRTRQPAPRALPAPRARADQAGPASGAPVARVARPPQN